MNKRHYPVQPQVHTHSALPACGPLHMLKSHFPHFESAVGGSSSGREWGTLLQTGFVIVEKRSDE